MASHQPKTAKERREEETKKWKRIGKCNQCGKCCKFKVFAIADEHRGEYLEGFGFKLNNDIYELEIPCKYLTKDNKCGRWENVPKVCKEFPVFGDCKFNEIKDFCGYKFVKKSKEK